MSAHPLDRPVWGALTTTQARLAQGDARAWRLDPAYGPFAAAADGAPTSQAALAALIPPGGTIWLLEAGDAIPPPGTRLVRQAACTQMVARAIVPGSRRFEIVPLLPADAPAMQALAALTQPGPFAPRTPELSPFLGIKQDGVLVAMAGERLQPAGFAELSGVCTHPDHRGRGYAGGLMRAVAERVLARGDTPFLHVYASNAGAIALYETLGFVPERTVIATVLARA